MILRNDPEARRILESVADIAFIAGAKHYHSGNSRADIDLFIDGAFEFEKKREEDEKGNETYGGEDYMTAIERFAHKWLDLEEPVTNEVQPPVTGNATPTSIGDGENTRRRTTMSKNYAGIDYSGPGSAINRDPETGIRYGVISQHSIQSDVMSDIWSEARDLSYEAAVEGIKQRLRDAVNSGNPRQYLQDSLKDIRIYTADIDEMEAIIRGQICSLDDKVRGMWDVISDAFGDRYEPCDSHDWLWEKDGYTLSNCLQADVFVSKSPYFTYAQFCSPCVPGAGNLDRPQHNPESIAWNKDRTIDPSAPKENYIEMTGEESGWPRVFCLGHDFFENEEAPYPVFSVATGKRVVMVEKKEECPSCKGGDIRPEGHEIGQRCRRCGGLGYEVKKVEVEQ